MAWNKKGRVDSINHKSRVRGQFQVPPVFEPASDAQVAIFFKHLLTDFEPSVREAAKFARLSKKQYEDLMEHNEMFRDKVKEWENHALDLIEDKARTLAMRGDASMVRFILENKKSAEYGRKQKLDITHSVKTYEDIAAMTPEQRQELKNRLLGKS